MRSILQPHRQAPLDGVPIGPDVLISVRGRKSGLPRTTPLTICENSDRRGLISPFGEVNWVRNLRAAGRATITVGRRREEVTAVEWALRKQLS